MFSIAGPAHLLLFVSFGPWDPGTVHFVIDGDAARGETRAVADFGGSAKVAWPLIWSASTHRIGLEQEVIRSGIQESRSSPWHADGAGIEDHVNSSGTDPTPENPRR